MLPRAVLPLTLAEAEEGEPIHGRTRLQKMVFLMQQELEDEGVDLDWTDRYRSQHMITDLSQKNSMMI